MEYLWIILRRDAKSLFTMGGRREIKRRLSFLLGIVFFIGLAGAVGYGSFWLFDYIESSLPPVTAVKAAIEINMLNGIALFTLIMVLMTGIQTTYKTIYESDDIGFLMAQPVPVTAIFTAKFLISYATVAAGALVFVLPAWIGFGLAARQGPVFYLLVVSSLALLMLFAHGVISVLLLIAMRYLPGRKMKQLFIAATAIVGVIIVLVSQIAGAKMQHAEDPIAMLEAIGRGQLMKTWYLPSTWMVNSVLGTISEFGLNPVPYGVTLVTGAAGLSLASIGLSGRWFMAGWASRTEETGAGKASKKRRRTGTMTSWAPKGGFWTVLRKDLRLLVRDPLVWYNLAIGIIVVGFFIFNNMRTGSPQGVTPGGETAEMLGASALLISVMMGSVTGAQTGGISLSREGPSFWLIRGNPVSPLDVFKAKMVYALLPPSVLFILSTVALEVAKAPRYPFPWGILLGASMVVVVASVQILLDVFFPDFTMKVEFGSSKTGRGTGKLLTTMFASMGLMIFLFFVLSIPFTPIAGKLWPAAPMDSLVAATRWAVLLAGVLAGAAARFFGVRRLGRLLRDM